jgi:hypothetical protein
MTLKHKVVGFFAGTVLSLGMVAGSMAAPGSVGTTVTLLTVPCTVSVTGAAVDFGTYQYNPNDNEYVRNGSVVNSTFTVAAYNGTEDDFASGCNAEITASSLTSSGSGQIDVTLDQGATFGNPLAVNVVPGTARTETVNASIAATLADSYDPLTYSGTITVSSANAAQ